ncbi:MAG: hypothetical protein SPL57_07590 [Lachnospiraceae bacterium]|nr:hypothetical protein [Lachnospiraceae bacterium]
MMRQDKYGINVKKWCREHEKQVEGFLSGDHTAEETKKELSYHLRKLHFLAHERLIHLIVVFFTIVITLCALMVMLFLPETFLASAPIFLGFLILLAFYLAHYFFLENTVQHWYRLYEELLRKIPEYCDVIMNVNS